MAHIFVSYSRKNRPAVDGLIARLHEAGHTSWLDRRSIRLGDRWELAIGRGIADADVFLAAISKEALDSEWVKREIEIARRQHKPILPVIVGPLNTRCLPSGLSELHAISLIEHSDAGAWKLLRDLGSVTGLGKRIPFLVDHPRLTGFLGRDEMLRNLHESLMTAGPTGIRPAGVSGMGGIGKTQLAIEYAHRYRYFYPGGVFMLNASTESWTEECARVALRLHLSPDNPDRPVAMADGFLHYLDQNSDSLLILDNVADVGSLRQKTIGSSAIVINLPCHQLFTTRQRFEASGMHALSVDVLPLEDARALLTSKRGDLDPEDPNVTRVCDALGRLPLGLALAATFLERKPNVTPQAYLAHLNRRGLDATHREARLKAGDLEAYYDASVAPALKAQWRLLEGRNTAPLLQVMALHEENARVPEARLGLMCGLRDSIDGVVTPLGDALRDASVANLLERLDGNFARMHPVVRDFVLRERKPDWTGTCATARKRLIDTLENVETLEDHCARRGVEAVVQDLGAALALQGGSHAAPYAARTQSLLRVLQREHRVLRNWQPAAQPAFLAQQLAKRAHEAGLTALARRARARVERLKAAHVSLAWRTGVAPRLNLVHPEQYVNSGAVILGGKRALTVALEAPLREWDLETGEVTRSGNIDERGATGLAVSADGRVAIVAPERGDPVIWDVDAWEVRHVLLGNGPAHWAVSVSPDGWRGLTRSGHGLALWDLRTGKRLRMLRGRGKDSVNAVSFTADGRQALTGWDRGAVMLWDLESGRTTRQLGRHQGAVWAVAVSPEGRFAFTGADDDTIAIWDLTGRSDPVFRFGHTAIVRSIAALPDGRHFWSASGDNTLKLWHRARRRPLFSVQAHNGYIRGLSLSADGVDVLTAAADGTARLWNRSEIEAARSWPKPHGGPVTFVGVFPEGKQVISSSWDGGVHVRDLVTGHLIRAWSGDSYSQFRSAAMTRDGKNVFLGGDQELFMLHAPDGDPVEIGGVELPREVAMTSDGRLGICDGLGRCVTLWDLERGKRKRTLLRSVSVSRKHSPNVYSVALAPDGRYAFASVEREGLHIWDLKKGGSKKTLRKDKQDRLLMPAPDGEHLVCVTGEGKVEIIRIPEGRLAKAFEAGPIVSMALSPSGKYFVTGTLRATVHVWDIRTGTCLATYGADSVITALALGRDLTSIVIGDDVGRLQMLHLHRLRLA